MPSLVPGPVSSTSSSSRLSFPSLTLSCITSARLCWTGLTPGGCLSDSQGWWWCCSCPEQMVTTDYTEYCWVLTISSHRWFSPTPVLYSALVHPVLYTTGGDNNTITRASSAYCSVTALSSTISVITQHFSRKEQNCSRHCPGFAMREETERYGFRPLCCTAIGTVRQPVAVTLHW